MKIDFAIERNVYGEYCLSCHARNTTQPQSVDGKKSFLCSACGSTNERQLIVDPKISWWLDETQSYCHESAGILLVNDDRQLLLFELTKYPYGFTVPAGHVDTGESAKEAVIRETKEEVGVGLSNPLVVTETMIHGDSCRRGSDDHKWTLFIEKISPAAAATIAVDDREGSKPTWLDVADIKRLQLPEAMRFLFNTYEAKIISMVQDL